MIPASLAAAASFPMLLEGLLHMPSLAVLVMLFVGSTGQVIVTRLIDIADHLFHRISRSFRLLLSVSIAEMHSLGNYCRYGRIERRSLQ